MRYICLLYGDQQWLTLPEAERRTLVSEYTKLTDDLTKAGQYVGGSALEAAKSAKTVRVRNGTAQTTDGPFAETKEQLGGYFIIEAADMDEALAIAARIPAARRGSVEVRTILET